MCNPQVTGDVRERERLGTNKLNRRSFEHSVMFFANKTGVFNGLMYNIPDIGVYTYDTYVVLMGL